MKVPNFAEIANVYAAAIDFRNYPQLSQVDAGRFISFDMRAADGCEYIARISRGFSELEPILLQGKERYDRDIQSNKVICNPSRVMLLRLIGSDATSVIHSQLAAVDNYDLLRYIVDNGPWPNDHWDVVCPELAEVAKRLHDLHNVSIEVADPVEPEQLKAINNDIATHAQSVERLAELLKGIQITELVQTFNADALIEFLEGRMAVGEEDRLLGDMWVHISRDLAQAVVLHRWPGDRLRTMVRSLMPRSFSEMFNNLTLADICMVVRGDQKPTFSNARLNAAVVTARSVYNAAKGGNKNNQGVKKVAEKLNIEYHSRLGTENGVMSGTVTLAVNGELFIVDVHCLKGSDRVTNRWVTLPQQGYDTTVHSLVRWFDDVAAAAIMITIYPDNGRPQTVTVTLNA